MKQIIFFAIILSFLSFIIDNQEVLAFESIDAAITPRIVGGEDADIEVFPYVASLRKSGDYFCAATCITEDGLLSAAHCFTHTPNVVWPYFDVSVHTGTNSLQERGTVSWIKKVIIHPGWSGQGIKLHDIVYIRLEKEIKFDRYQNKINMVQRQFISNNWGWVTSWGSKILNSEAMSDRLQKLRMWILIYYECQRRLSPDLLLEKEQLCGYQDIRYGCSKGDDGAPLVVYDKLVGIYSWTAGECVTDGRRPEIFVDVYQERGFIHYAILQE